MTALLGHEEEDSNHITLSSCVTRSKIIVTQSYEEQCGMQMLNICSIQLTYSSASFCMAMFVVNGSPSSCLII